jgi:hypothetical protein
MGSRVELAAHVFIEDEFPVTSLLAKLAIHKALGVYIAEDRVTICRVAATPAGAVEISRVSQSAPADRLLDVLRQAMTEFTNKKGRCRLPVAVGLPGSRFFFATRPTRGGSENTSAESMLQGVLLSPNVCIDDLIVDLIRTDLCKHPVASMAACRKKYLNNIMSILEQCGIRPQRVEPAPCALTRAAAERHKQRRRSKNILRVFLNDEQGLAVLVAGNLPIAWQTFALPSGGEPAAILCASRILQTLGKHYGIDSPLDTVVVHGRSDLKESLGGEFFTQELGVRLDAHSGPELDDGQIAFGLALGCLKQEQKAFDLARTLKPRASLWEIFPLGETAFQGALMVCMGLMLWVHGENLASRCESVQTENRKHQCLMLPQEQLEKEKKDLKQRVEAVRGFLASRILWTSYTHDIPARLPANALLNSMQGICELEIAGKKKESASQLKKSFVMRATAPISSNGSMPREIDDFLNSLRGNPLLKRDFPIVELADIKRFQLFTGSQPMANFTVVCLPKSDKVAASGEGESKGEQQKDDK